MAPNACASATISLLKAKLVQVEPAGGDTSASRDGPQCQNCACHSAYGPLCLLLPAPGKHRSGARTCRSIGASWLLENRLARSPVMRFAVFAGRGRRVSVRGIEWTGGSLFSHVDLKARVPVRHPLQAMRDLVDAALATLDGALRPLHSHEVGPRSRPGKCCGQRCRNSENCQTGDAVPLVAPEITQA